MNYPESLDYLQNIYWHGIKLGLQNIEELLQRLGNPQERLTVIHLAGTNGKGSATAMLSAILQAAGFRVGAYTSPHLIRYNERFQINGTPISDEDFAAVATQVAGVCAQMTAEGLPQPTVFEVLTAMAFVYFEQQAVEYVLLEVGMGGRFDATNVVKNPLLCLILSIGMDHMEYLGNTLEQIAAEKAGIVKPHRPVVLYHQSETVYRVIEAVCRQNKAPLYYNPTQTIHVLSADLSGSRFTLTTPNGVWENVELALPGAYQLENCATVLLACRALQEAGVPLPEAAIRTGLKTVRWPGRMEVVAQNPTLILDGAHNIDGIAMLARSLPLCCPGRDITLVLGILGDKEYEKMTALLLPLAQNVVLTEPDNARRLPAEALEQVAAHLGRPAPWEKDPAAAVRLARKLAGPEGIVLCAGSLYLIGAIRKKLETGEL